MSGRAKHKSRGSYTVSDRRKHPLLTIVILYIVCLIAGIICVYLVEMNQHSALKTDAARAAEQLAESGEIENSYEYMHLYVYLYEDGEITYPEGDFSAENEGGGDYIKYIRYLSSFAKDGKVHYLILPTLPAFRFYAVSAVPVSDGQTLYMFHTIQYLRSILITVILICTMVFVIVAVYNRVLRKKDARLTEIYRLYVANVSHELKSPIASIRALTETLQEGLVKNEEERSRCYGMIYRETRGLEHAVQDILELSRVQEHRTDFTCAEISAADLFAPVTAKYGEICEDLNIRFETDASVYALPALYTNADRIRQLLEILLNNAVKFMDEEREGRILISAECQSRRALIRVRDNGIGISQKDLPHIFERFYKSGAPKNRSGTGLGLAIAKEITLQLNEEISVTGAPGEGCEFTFTIRLAGRSTRRIFRK